MNCDWSYGRWKNPEADETPARPEGEEDAEAHLRLGSLEYHRVTEKTSTRIRLRVDRYVGEDEQAHLISVFGNDSDVGAITAAVHGESHVHADFSGW